jgi:hypothetical protein
MLAIAVCAAWIYLFADPEDSSAIGADVARGGRAPLKKGK